MNLPLSLPLLRDLAERAVATFAQGFCAEWLVTQSLDAQSLRIALVAGLASLAKGVVASRVGDPQTASLVQ